MNRQIAYPYFWTPEGKVQISDFQESLNRWKEDGDRIVTTNGCFDLLHIGHVTFLSDAKKLGDRLIVGLNSDRSVRQIKGAGKPLMNENERSAMLSALQSVDAVVVFDDLLPNRFLGLIRPAIHCKAGDYTVESLPEAEIIDQYGGKIEILPLVEGISTSRIIQRTLSGTGQELTSEQSENIMSPSDENTVQEKIVTYLLDSSNLFRQTAYKLNDPIHEALKLVTNTLQNGNKILLCGNGGSAADAQHIAAEFVGRFKMERNALPALALTTDTSILTAIGNDYGFDEIFARQIEAHGNEGDLLIAISTSGNSKNIIKAAIEAKKRGVRVLGLTGSNFSEMKKLSDLCLDIPSDDTPLIQQLHIGILHLLCDLGEKQVSSGK